MDDKKAIYCQFDVRWAKATLGNTIYTIRDYGCTVTAISYICFKITGQNFTPAELAKKLSFDSDGLVIWGSLSVIGLKAERVKSQPTTKIYQDQGDRMIIELKYNPRHWVAFQQLNTFGTLQVMDPLKGDFVAKKPIEVSGYCLLKPLKEPADFDYDPVPNWPAVANGKDATALWSLAKKAGYISKDTKFDEPMTAGKLIIILARLFPDKF